MLSLRPIVFTSTHLNDGDDVLLFAATLLPDADDTLLFAAAHLHGSSKRP